MASKPFWWEWELELSPHLLKRMVDRQFNEAELRTMLEKANPIHPNHEAGRWIAACEHDGRTWEVILEPALDEKVLVVVTAYPIEPRT